MHRFHSEARDEQPPLSGPSTLKWEKRKKRFVRHIHPIVSVLNPPPGTAANPSAQAACGRIDVPVASPPNTRTEPEKDGTGCGAISNASCVCWTGCGIQRYVPGTNQVMPGESAGEWPPTHTTITERNRKTVGSR